MGELLEGKCENLETLSVAGARRNLRVKVAQLAAFALVYLVMCLLPVPLEISAMIVFGSLYWLDRVVSAVVHRACVLELVKERERCKALEQIV